MSYGKSYFIFILKVNTPSLQATSMAHVWWAVWSKRCTGLAYMFFFSNDEKMY